MRPIKFRIWNGTSMDEVGEITFHTDGSYNVNCEYPVNDKLMDEKFGGNRYYLMQFTGLKDKNRKEIYEGDIVLLPDSEIVPITDEGQGPIEEINHLCPVEFQEGCFGLKVLENSGVFHKGFWSFDSIINSEGIDLDEIEVIGNLYENPNLLK